MAVYGPVRHQNNIIWTEAWPEVTEFQVLIWDKHMIVAVLNRLMESQFSSLDSQDWVAQTSIKFKSQLNIKCD
jgi:hypothetical protein